ncbi:LuxR family transcriptional regulator [Blastococcus jejuensis]|uniref:LuxR family transcriptional regulator n=1 Tax=Blastococcus jejuensis TaxID=351224 RepID=A0ABP6PAV9_9ACTN
MRFEVVSPVLVGRERELAQLRAAVARTAAGEPGVVLVGGEAGVGKSRLLDAAFGDASGMRVLTGGCIELGGEGLPLVPLVEALRTVVRTTPSGDLDRLLGPARRELARLLPELAVDLPAPPATSGSTAQLFELVLGVLGRIGDEHPLALVVEDLHWADRTTLDLVAFLVRGLQGTRVLLVLTYRSDEVDRRSPLRPLLSGWERLRGVERLQLERFSRRETAAQVGAILGATPEPGMVDLVFDRSEGNAFFVEELVRTVRDGTGEHELPPSLRDVLLSRAERLSGPAQRLLRTAAVAGRWVPERLLSEVAAVSPAELYEALREAVDASLLVVDGTGRGYAFRHALTRDAVYEDLLPGERVELHTAYAEALDRAPGLAEDDASVAATLAVHWYAAHDMPRALAASVRAGRQAIAAFAPAEARRHLERALEVWRSVPDAETWAGADQVEVLRLTARATFHGGDPERALTLLERALDLVDPDTDPERSAFVVEQRAVTVRALGEDGAGVTELETALARLPVDPPSLARAAVLAALANTLMRVGSDRASEVARTALAAARATGATQQEAGALLTLGSALSYLADPAEGEAFLREGLQLALDAHDHETALRGYVNLSDALEAMGRHGDAATAARDGIELATHVGLSRSFGAYLTGNLVEPLVRLGEWREAERVAADVVIGDLRGVFGATVQELLGYLAVTSGRLDAALQHVREAKRQLGESREPQFTQALIYIEAEAARARGELIAAAELAEAGLAVSTAWSARYSWPLLWLRARTAADAAVRGRDEHRPPAVVLDPDLLGRTPAGPVGTASPAARGYRALTAAETVRRDGAPAVEAWRAAVAAWEEATDAWPLAYARYRLGEALCAGEDRAGAAAVLRLAAEAAEAMGAAPLLDDVRALARRARVPLDDGVPGPSPATGAPVPFGLTDREREVLALVAAGRSNGQIATALFISPKTASVHVSNILAKLGVSGRVEAAAVAHRLGLVPEGRP